MTVQTREPVTQRPPWWSAKRWTARHLQERGMELFILANGLTAVAILLGIMGLLVREGLPLFAEYGVLDFLLGRHWYPVSDPPSFGMLPAFAATLWITAGAIAIALPVGVGAAVFLAEVAPDGVRRVVKPTIELLAGVPSIVIGFIALTVVNPLVREWANLNTGLSGLTAAVMLAFMALPVIISISDDALRAVPREYREAAYALGATRWETVRHVLVPGAFSGITAAVMLGVGRAIGETMTVLMVAGGAIQIPRFITEPMRPMTATIAAEISNAVQGGIQYHALFMLGLVLFLLTFLVNLTADLVLERQRRRFRP